MPSPSTQGTPQRGSTRYDLILFRKKVVYRDGDELVPLRGAGYDVLHAFVYVSGRPRRASPVDGVKAYCPTTTRCEYRTPRRDGFADLFVISLDDDSIARLSSSDDMVAISTRRLDVDAPVVVPVTLVIAGQPSVTRRIHYAKLAP